jgi:hypothetical protein
MNYGVSIEPTRFLGAWFTDATANATANAAAFVTSLWGTVRISSAYGSKAGGGVQLRIFPVSRLSLELGAGSYLPDPYQGLPQAGYVTAGLRLFASHRAPAPTPAPVRPTSPPLTPARRGDSVVVRFHMEGATSVAIGGDWDGWEPHALQRLAGDLFEGALALRSGTYHFTLLVNGTEWVVPRGVAIITDEAGEMVGVLVVP